MYAIYGNIYDQYTPNVSIYAIHGSYGNVQLDIPWLDSEEGQALPNPSDARQTAEYVRAPRGPRDALNVAICLDINVLQKRGVP